MPRIILPALGLCLSLMACVHDDDARLNTDPTIDRRELGALLKLDCSPGREEARAARDDSKSTSERIASYQLAVKAFGGATEKIAKAFTREPDLLYLADGEELRARLARCQEQGTAFREELRRLEQGVEFKPLAGAPRLDVDAWRDEHVKKAKVSKKSKKAKAALAKAKRKKASRSHSVLAAYR